MYKKYFINILSTGLLFISTSSHAGYTVIRFASEIYPPFTTQHANKELKGFDIAVAKAICAIIDTKCTFNNDKFNDMIPSLKKHKYDAWINAITITEHRQKEISFSKPYFATKAMLMATDNTTFNAAPAEIKGKTIGVGEHTCYAQYLQNTYKDTIKVKTFQTKDEAIISLEKGEVDALIDDDIVLKHWRSIQKNPKKYRLIDPPLKYPQLIWHKYGIAVAKDNIELIKDLNHAIDHIEKDGTIDKLAQEYLTFKK
jgi:lysine-arginine-ornithine-binding protein